MAWSDAPRKPNGVDRLRVAQANAEARALQRGWGPLVSTGEAGGRVCFNFSNGSQVFWDPEEALRQQDKEPRP